MAGGALVPRPNRVPIDAAHDRVTDNVRRGSASPVRFSQLGDAHETPATNAQHYAYDSTTGLFVPVDPPDFPFSFAGALTTSTSPPWYPKNDVNVIGFACALGTAGTSTTTVVLKKNGSTTVATVNLTTGVSYDNAVVSPSVAIDGRTDYLTVTVSAVGTGAADLVALVELG